MVWLGKPAQPSTNPSGYPTYQMQLGQHKNISISSSPGASSATGNWWLNGNSLQIVGSFYGSSIMVEAVNEGLTNFYVTTSNACGISSTGGGLINVSLGGGGGPLGILSITPNPANNYVNLDFTPKNGNSVSLNEKTTFEIIIYSKTMELVYYNKTTETKLNLNTSSLKEGFYFVNIYNGKSVAQKQFIINHY